MRKKTAKKKIILPDFKYKSPLVTKFINCLMLGGKKSLASSIFYHSIDKASQSSEDGDGLSVWKKALENVTPSVEVKRRRVGGATYQIPEEVRESRRISLSIKWIISAARKRREKSMIEKLTSELLAASKEEGSAYKRKVEMHKTAESHKAYSHMKIK